jgi:hypothetical protein
MSINADLELGETQPESVRNMRFIARHELKRLIKQVHGSAGEISRMQSIKFIAMIKFSSKSSFQECMHHAGGN